jgi:ribosomal-protein-alanine N-acetyltransferase
LKTSPVNIRPAQQGDAEFIRALSALVFSRYGPYETILPEWFLSGIAQTFVAVMNEAPVGYAMLSADRWQHHSFSIAELLAIAVHPRNCRRGVGSRLMERVLQIAETSGVHILILHTGVHNRNAQALFKNHGFWPVGVKDGFYQGGQRAVMMQKEM